MYANSGAYTGPPAQTGGTTIAPSPPGAPVITSASASYDLSSGGPVESVVFNVPSNGGSPIQSFTATWVGDGTSGSYTVADGCPSCTTYQIIFPLPAFLAPSTVNGTTVYPYRVTVYATNGAGPGPPSDARSFAAVVPAPPPVDISAAGGPMTIGGVSGPGVAVHWQPPATDGGEPIGTYVVELFGSGLPSGGEDYDCFQQLNNCNEPAGLTAAQIALPPSAYGNRYTLQMFSVNGVGSSVLTSPPLTFIPIRPPDAPARIGASVDPGPPRACFRVSWAPPGYDGGSPITSYTVGWSGLGESRVIGVSASARSATLPLPYTYTAAPFKVFVLAANAAGLGPAKVTTVRVPGCPRPHICSTGGPRPRPVR